MMNDKQLIKLKKYIFYILIISIILLSFLIIFCLNNGIYFFQVNGNSMYPLFEDGEWVICQKQLDYEVNDIVVYDNKWIDTETYELTCHRIISKNNSTGFLILKGDNNPSEDIGVQSIDDIFCKIMFKE